MLGIGKVQQAALPLEGGKLPVILRRHIQKGHHGRAYGAQVSHGLLRRQGEPLRRGGHLLFAQLPQALGPLLEDGVCSPLAPKGGEGDGEAFRRLFPALCCGLGKDLQTQNGPIQRGAVIGLQRGVKGQLLPELFQFFDPIGGQLPGVLQEEFAPGGVLGHLAGTEGVVRLPLLQPAQGVGMALGAAVDVKDDLLHRLIVPVSRQGIHQGAEAGILLDVRITALQHRFHGLGTQVFSLCVVTQAEVRVQARAAAALPEKVQAEGIDGGDLGAVNQSCIAPQVGVGGVLGQQVI